MSIVRPEDFSRLVAYMQGRYGTNLAQKQTHVEGRMNAVLRQHDLSNMGEFLDLMEADKSGDVGRTLVTRLTTNYTYFYREQQHYQYLREHVLPWLKETVRDHDLRIWSAGCSSGEEVYTIAMTIDNFFGLEKPHWDAGILATDISPQVLQMAVSAVYPSDRMQGLPEEWVKKYFKRLPNGQFQVCDTLRREVTFRTFNLMQKTLPFKRKFNIIFCRNVMIYFDKQTRLELVRRFYDALVPGGYFFIGMAETLSRTESEFQLVQPSIFRKPL